MIQLDISGETSREPEWVPIPALEHKVKGETIVPRIRVAPIDTPSWRAAGRLVQARLPGPDEGEEAQAYLARVMPDLKAWGADGLATAMAGEAGEHLSEILSAVTDALHYACLAEIAITEWEGFGDLKGEPAPVTANGIQAAMRNVFFATAFRSHVTAKLSGIFDEGNG